MRGRDVERTRERDKPWEGGSERGRNSERQ